MDEDLESSDYFLSPESDGELLDNEEDSSIYLESEGEDADTDFECDDLAEDENENNDAEGEKDDEMELEENFDDNVRVGWDQVFVPQVGVFLDPVCIVKEEMEVNGSTTYFQMVRQFLTDEIVQDIVTESNRFASIIL